MSSPWISRLISGLIIPQNLPAGRPVLWSHLYLWTCHQPWSSTLGDVIPQSSGFQAFQTYIPKFLIYFILYFLNIYVIYTNYYHYLTIQGTKYTLRCNNNYTDKFSSIFPVSFFFFFFFCFLKAAPEAYGGSQERGPIRAVATGLHHSPAMQDSKPHLRSTPQLTEHQILNPLSKVRDRTLILMDPSQVS